MAAAKDEKIKASCIAAVAGGMGIRNAARTYGVDPATVIKWRDQAGLSVNTMATEDARAKLQQALIEYVFEALKAMTAHVRLAQDDLWLRRGSGSDLSLLHKTIAENIGRLVAAEQVGGSTGFLEEADPIRRAS